VKIQ